VAGIVTGFIGMFLIVRPYEAFMSNKPNEVIDPFATSPSMSIGQSPKHTLL
jgi:hypothetical protein